MNTHADKTQKNKSKAVANNLPKLQNSGKSILKFADNRPETAVQRKLQAVINYSPRLQQMKAYQEMANNSAENVLQAMFTFDSKNISTLAQLNNALTLTAYSNQTNTRPIILPISVAHFAHGQTASEVDTAIHNSNLVLCDYIEVSDIWDAIDAELIKITAPPTGYVLINSGPFNTYMSSPYAFSNHQQDLLVNATNNQGLALHQSAKTHNMSAQADAYIHDLGTNAIFSYQNMGVHRNIPMVCVLQQGKVNDGMHNFKK